MTAAMIVLAVLLAVVLLALGLFLFACRRRPVPDFTEPAVIAKWGRAEQTEEILAGISLMRDAEDIFLPSYDGLRLHGQLLQQPGAKGTILLFHGYRSCWQIDFGLVLPYYYDTLGYSLLLVDQRAHGQSQGKYLTFGVRERMDVISWATYMGQKLGPDAPLILGGLSMGATTVLMASCFDFPANVRAIIADCGFTSPYEIAKSVLRRDYPRLPVGLLLPICGLFTRLYAGFGLHDASTLDAVRESRYPILFIHGTGDTFVPCEMTKEAYAACTSEKELILVDSAEHGKSYLVEKGRVEEALCRFLATHTE
mgnify:CR=1 FL=1